MTEKANKLRCRSCGQEFYTTLPIRRVADEPCPNCKERALEETNSEIDAVNDSLIIDNDPESN